jgi:hypothetical protein
MTIANRLRACSNPRIQNLNRGPLEVTLIAGGQNEIVLQSNGANRRVHEVYWVARRIRRGNHLRVGLGGVALQGFGHHIGTRKNQDSKLAILAGLRPRPVRAARALSVRASKSNPARGSLPSQTSPHAGRQRRLRLHQTAPPPHSNKGPH